jgi:hypothetical protein
VEAGGICYLPIKVSPPIPRTLRESSTHMRNNVYTKLALAEGTGHIPGFSLQCVEAFRSSEHAKKVTHKMIWSAGTIKKVHHQVETNMLVIHLART